MRAKCKKCGDIVEVTDYKEFKTCKCGAIGLDYGDGYYCRAIGYPENFDGEIEDRPALSPIDDCEEDMVDAELGVDVEEEAKEIMKLRRRYE